MVPRVTGLVRVGVGSLTLCLCLAVLPAIDFSYRTEATASVHGSPGAGTGRIGPWRASGASNWIHVDGGRTS